MAEEKSGSPTDRSIAAPDALERDEPADNANGVPASDPTAKRLAGARAEARESPADLRSTMAAQTSVQERLSLAPAEGTELERRVLAHERILQALIAHMAETEPKLLLRLSDTFCLPMQMVHCEHDHTDTDSYAAEFIRSVLRLGDRAGRKPHEAVSADRLQADAPRTSADDVRVLFPLPRIQVRQAGGVWRVTRDDLIYGDYCKEQDALAAVDAARGPVVEAP